MENPGILEVSEIVAKVNEEFARRVQIEPDNKELFKLWTTVRKIARRNAEQGAELLTYDVDELKVWLKAYFRIMECKMTSDINQKFSKIAPHMAHLDRNTTKYFFITIRPKWLEKAPSSTAELLPIFRGFCDFLLKSSYYDWGIGCWEITAGEGSRVKASLHTHIIAKLDHANPTTKKNNGKKGVEAQLIEKMTGAGFIKKYGDIVDLSGMVWKNHDGKNIPGPGMKVDSIKGFDHEKVINYMKGNKNDASKKPDIDITRKWRISNHIEEYWYKNKEGIPEEISDLF